MNLEDNLIYEEGIGHGQELTNEEDHPNGDDPFHDRFSHKKATSFTMNLSHIKRTQHKMNKNGTSNMKRIENRRRTSKKIIHATDRLKLLLILQDLSP